MVYLTNALRHCREAEGECEVEVSGSVEPEAERLVVRVRNTGIAVSAVEDITQLSRDGGRADGTSEGLRFARDIIAAAGGSTWAEPATAPAGAIFALALPWRRGDDEAGSGGD